MNNDTYNKLLYNHFLFVLVHEGKSVKRKVRRGDLAFTFCKNWALRGGELGASSITFTQ